MRHGPSIVSRRLLPRRAVGFILALAVTGCGTTHVLRNQALELTFNVAEGQSGTIRLTGIRDLVDDYQWLSAPSPLFEIFADDRMSSSDAGIVVDSVTQAGTKQLTIGARTGDLKFRLVVQITMEADTGPAVVTGSISNGGADWFGPFDIGDRGPGPIPVFPVDAELAAVRRSAQQEEILVSGFDGILYTAEERDDNAWTPARPLYSTSSVFRYLFPPGARIAAIRRNDHQRDAFALSAEGHLYTVFRLDEGWWSEPVRLSHAAAGPFVSGGPVVALSVHEQTDPPPTAGPRQNEVAVFAIARTGRVVVSHESNDGPFSEPTPINPTHLPLLGKWANLAVVKRNENQQDLFVVDPQGRLLTTFHLQDAPLWSDFIELSGPGPTLPPGARLAAIRGRGDDVHVFVVGAADNDPVSGRIFETHERDNGAWSVLTPLTPPLSALAPGSAITAVRRTGSEIDVMAVLRDGSIGMLTRGVDESWTDMRVLSTARPVSPNGKVTVILRRPGQLDLFGIDQTNGRIWTSADGASSALIRTVFPKIRFKGPSTLAGLFGMVPQEIGTLTRLKGPQEAFHTLGMPYSSDPTAQTIGLPQAMNAMEVLNIARKERSLFVADLRGDVEHGRAPIQFTLAPDEVAGFWVAPLRGQSAVSLPSFAIGVGSADWRRAVDLYVNRHTSEWSSPIIPAWLREAGALYTYGGGGSGGIYLALPNGGTSLKSYADTADPNDCPRDDRSRPVKGTFRCALKRMLREARGLGTNVIYLNDYWQAVSSPIETCPEISRAWGMWYFCKGDYFIRSDLKDRRDPDAVSTLRAAIDDVHNSPDDAGRRGRVILYLEPFVVHKNSAVGNAFGELWGGRFPGGPVWRPFGQGDPSIEMSQANGEWQHYVVETARKLIETTHADGIFLDSAGWRLNLPTETKQEVVLNSALENSMALLNLADRVRTAIRSVPHHEDAVVLAETTSGPMWRHVDGGVSADFLPSSEVFTGRSTFDGRLLVSPIRYGRSQINVFSNGIDLNGLNQVFATGHGLALCSNWEGTTPNFIRENAAYIKKLVQARQNLASALVHGQQVHQVDATGEGSAFVTVFTYSGTPDVITILNPTPEGFTGTVPVHALMLPGTKWKDAITDDLFTVTSSGVNVTVPPATPCNVSNSCGLRVLVRTTTQ